MLRRVSPIDSQLTLSALATRRLPISLIVHFLRFWIHLENLGTPLPAVALCEISGDGRLTVGPVKMQCKVRTSLLLTDFRFHSLIVI
jgi:hypothetical protein